MFTILEASMALILIAGGQAVLPRNTLITYNNEFARSVDAGENCWHRVGGEVGVYGSPENYSWYPMCNRVKPV